MNTATPIGPNPQQLDAINHVDGPVLIIAGPGSGKTFTLVERVINLIDNHSVQPESILVSTFTQKAAAELMTRVSNRLLEKGSQVNPNALPISTLHSFCLSLLEDHREFTRLKRNFTLMDQFDQQYFLYQNLSEYLSVEGIGEVLGDTERTSAWRQAAVLMSWINKVSEEALDHVILESASEQAVAALGRLYQIYQQQLEEHNALDFSTIQFEALKLLQSNSDVLEKVRGTYRYIMIDEYQDTNTIQEKIIFLVGEAHKNICVVGDDDQGLYRFRGATIRNILEFPDKFNNGECKQIYLTTNYRSDARIVDFYNDWMGQADWGGEGGESYRFDKEVIPQASTPASYPTLFKVSGQNDESNWADEVTSFLTKLRNDGTITDWNQVAFLFRSVRNPKVVDLAEKLEAAGIPIYAPRSKMYFDREEIRLMIGAIIFLFPQFREVRKVPSGHELRIWEYYDENCFRAFAEELRKPEHKELLVWSRTKAAEHATLSSTTNYGFTSLFYELLQFKLFSRFLKDANEQDVRDSRSARNLAMFSRVLAKFEYLHHITVLNPAFLEKNIKDLFNRYLRFLYDGGIDEYEDDTAYAPSGCVSFMTIHQSKGLEFPIVFVGTLDAVPRKQFSELDVLLQESFYSKPPFEPVERTKTMDFWRLFYTAFSRAQNMLVLTAQENVPSGRGHRNVPSKPFQMSYGTLKSWRELNFEATKIALDNIKPVNVKNEYSFTSNVLIFETCPQQYRFFKELEFAPVRKNAILFGTLVHQTIEDIHKAVLRGQSEIVNEARIEGWFRQNYYHLTKRERVYLTPISQNIALDHVQRYAKRESHTWDRLHDAEVEVALMKENYVLKGRIDLVRGEGDTVEVIDFKSEKKPDLFKEQERLQRYQRQLQFYAHLVEEQLGLTVSKMHLYYTGDDSGVPYVSYPNNTSAVQGTIDKIDDIVKQIEGQEFGMDDRPQRVCSECDMQSYCDMNFVKGKSHC